MKKYTKTLGILLATTCLSAVYAMDPSEAVSSTAVTVRGDGGSGSVLTTRSPMAVSMVGIDPAGYELVERVRTADVASYWSRSIGANKIPEDIREISDASARNLVLGFHNAKYTLSLKMNEADRKKGTHEARDADSQVREAQKHLDSLDRQLTLLGQNGGSLGVAVRAVAVTQDEKGGGWQATDLDSDGFNVVVATRQNTFDSVAFKKAKERGNTIPLMEIQEVDNLISVTPIPRAQLKRVYTFLEFFNPVYNPFEGLTNKSEDGIFETLNALRRFYDGSLVTELQELSTRVHDKAKSVRSSAEKRTLFTAVNTIAIAIDNILTLLGEGSPLAEAFRHDIGKVMPAFTDLQGLCSDYVTTLGIEDKAFPVAGVHESMFAVEKVLVSDIYKVMRHLEKITSILQAKRGDSNPFQKHINKLSQFIKDDQAFLGLLETHDLGTTVAAIQAEETRLLSELPVAEALFQERFLKVQARKEELSKSGSSGYDQTLNDLENDLRSAEQKVDSLKRRLEGNPKWITPLQASFAARETLRGFHGAFARQFHVLQTPKVWESVKLDELGTLKQSLTDLNMLVEELKGFYNEAHNEVVRVAAKAGKVLDMRHVPSMIADKEAGYKEVELPVAPPLTLTDGSVSGGGSGMDGALVGMPQAGMLAMLGLKHLADGPGMTNPLGHLVDVADRADRATKNAEDRAAVFERVRAQAEAIKASRASMKAAAKVVEVRDPLANLGMMPLQQVKNVLGVTNSLRGAP
ncbi:MAG: hypothetical protein K2Q34_02685, partial [Alphaproteobacteria bacterium]|nr:hypothetical protein [Alphaproteobacteria bacterium]